MKNSDPLPKEVFATTIIANTTIPVHAKGCDLGALPPGMPVNVLAEESSGDAGKIGIGLALRTWFPYRGRDSNGV